MTGSHMKRGGQPEAVELNSKRYRKEIIFNAGTSVGESMVSPSEQIRFSEALAYLQDVKDALKEESKYQQFLRILKDFQNSNIDTTKVVSLVKELFKDHVTVLLGFNAFLPKGYEIVDPAGVGDLRPPCRENDALPHQQKQTSAAKDQDVRALGSCVSQQEKPRMGFDDAINFVNKVKLRFCSKEEHVYKEFLDILNRFRQGTPIWACTRMIAALFREHADLVEDFDNFLPPHRRPQPFLLPGARGRLAVLPNSGSTGNGLSTSTSRVREMQEDVGEKSTTGRLTGDQGENTRYFLTPPFSKIKKQRKWTEEDGDVLGEGSAVEKSTKFKRSRKQIDEEGASSLPKFRAEATDAGAGYSRHKVKPQVMSFEEEETEDIAPKNSLSKVIDLTMKSAEDKEQNDTSEQGNSWESAHRQREQVNEDDERFSEHFPVTFKGPPRETPEDNASESIPPREQLKEDLEETLQFYHRMRVERGSKQQIQTEKNEESEAPERPSPTVKGHWKRIANMQHSETDKNEEREATKKSVKERRKRNVVDDREDIVQEHSPREARMQQKKGLDTKIETLKTYCRAREISTKCLQKQIWKAGKAEQFQHPPPKIYGQLKTVAENEEELVAEHSLPTLRNSWTNSEENKDAENISYIRSDVSYSCTWGNGEGKHPPELQTLHSEQSPAEIIKKQRCPDKNEKENAAIGHGEGEDSVDEIGEEMRVETSKLLPGGHFHTNVRIDARNRHTNEGEDIVPQFPIFKDKAPEGNCDPYEQQDAKFDCSESEGSGKEVPLETVPPKRASARLACELFRKQCQAAKAGLTILAAPISTVSMKEQQRLRLQQFEDDKKNLLLQQRQGEFFEKVKKTVERNLNSAVLARCLKIFCKAVTSCNELRPLVLDIMEGQEVEYAQCKRCTPSYCHLPKSYLKPLTTHRSNRVQECLNDSWVSVGYECENKQNPHDEGSGARKQIGREGASKGAPHDQRLLHEERLSFCEDDQYELDVLRETTANTIRRVAGMVELTKAPGFHMQSFNWDEYLTPVNLRCIERIYCEFAVDIMEQARKNSVIALPIILCRLQQKEENEWPEYQIEMDKVWAEVHSEHYHKSQDHSQFSDISNAETLIVPDCLPREPDLREGLMGAWNGHMGPDADSLDLSFEEPAAENVYQIVKYLLMEIRMTDEQFKNIQIVWSDHVESIVGTSLDEDVGQDSKREEMMAL